MDKPSTVAAVDVEALEREALTAIAGATTPDELDEARVQALGRKSPLKLALREVRDRETGMTLNAVRERIEQAVAERHAELSRPVEDPTFDPTLPGVEIARGSYHLITQLRRRIEDIFIGMGYEIFDGREVDTVENNFDALNTPEAHPSRDPRDTFYLDDNTLLRTHTSPSQIRAMRAHEPPVYVASLGRTYRRDTIDATHTPGLPPGRGACGRPRHHARRPARDDAGASRRECSVGGARSACVRASSPSPSRPSSST